MGKFFTVLCSLKIADFFFNEEEKQKVFYYV
jgi:hypothetical protein